MPFDKECPACEAGIPFVSELKRKREIVEHAQHVRNLGISIRESCDRGEPIDEQVDQLEQVYQKLRKFVQDNNIGVKIGNTIVRANDDFEKAARSGGFKDCKELHSLVASIDLTIPGALNAFKQWKDKDASKDGLLKILELKRKD